MKVLIVGTDEHRLVRVARPAWDAECSCGRMEKVGGSSSGVAEAWRRHVQAEAAKLGVEAVAPTTPTAGIEEVRRMPAIEARLGAFAKVKRFTTTEGGADYRVSCQACGLHRRSHTVPAFARVESIAAVAAWWDAHVRSARHGGAIAEASKKAADTPT